MLLSNIQNARIKNINPGLQTASQILQEREVIRKIKYAEQRTLKERKNFTIYAKPIKIM